MSNNQLAVTPQNAIALLEQQQTPEAKAVLDYITLLKKKDIAVLGQDEAFVLTDQGGQIKAFKSALTLSVKNGGLVDIMGTKAISAQGYENWAESTGASVIFPKKVETPTGEAPNPHPIIEDGRIIGIIARAVAFRYSRLGIPQVSDWTTLYSPPSYRMVDLFAKAKKFPQCFKLLPNGTKPTAKDDETWACYPFDEVVSFWVNTTHKEVFDWYSQMTKRDQKAMDTAQTFVRRNALKHLSGLQKAPHDNWTFAVLAWRPTGENLIKWDGKQYSSLQDRVESMINGESQDFTGQIEYVKGTSDASEDEITETIEAETDPEDSQSEPAEETKPEKSEASKVMKNLFYLSENFTDEFKKACDSLKLDYLSIHDNGTDDETAAKICQKVSEIVDAQN